MDSGKTLGITKFTNSTRTPATVDLIKTLTISLIQTTLKLKQIVK